MDLGGFSAEKADLGIIQHRGSFKLNILYQILLEAWDIFLDVSVFMLFGFFIAGLLHVFFRTDQIKTYLGHGKIKPVFLSALFGIPIPL